MFKIKTKISDAESETGEKAEKKYFLFIENDQEFPKLNRLC